MEASLSLRGRFLLASLALSAALLGGFSLAIHQFIEAIEHEIIDVQFVEEFERFVIAYKDQGVIDAPGGRNFQALSIASGEERALPPVLRRLTPGIHDEIDIDGREYSVGKQVVNGTTLILLFDIELEPVERLEGRVMDIAVWAGISAILMGVALALWLSRIVMQPVQNLAATVAAIVPGRDRPGLLESGGKHEIGIIARAFDATLERFDEFTERERAFTRDASHELRTPLAVVLSGLQLIEADPATSSGSQVRLTRIHAAAEQIQALIEGLLFLARAADVERDGPAFSVGDLLQDAVRIQTTGAVNRPLAINLDIERDHATHVPRGLLLCVVNNLLRNAVEHSESRQVDVVLAGPSLVIEDYGKGIEARAQAAVFDRETRGADSTGDGVGLNLVKRICDRLGWRIELSSAPGAGTRFELHLG